MVLAYGCCYDFPPFQDFLSSQYIHCRSSPTSLLYTHCIARWRHCCFWSNNWHTGRSAAVNDRRYLVLTHSLQPLHRQATYLERRSERCWCRAGLYQSILPCCLSLQSPDLINELQYLLHPLFELDNSKPPKIFPKKSTIVTRLATHTLISELI